MAHYRFDAIKPHLAPAQTDSFGTVLAEAVLAQVGVTTYTEADGTKRREYKPAEELFAPESLRSLHGAPLTLRHPKAELLEALQGAAIRPSGAVLDPGPDAQRPDILRGKLRIHDPAAIEAAAGGMRAISLGYEVMRLDATPGVWEGPNGPEPYTHVQRGIIYNHAAIDWVGRQPEARLRLDSVDSFAVDTATTPLDTAVEVAQASVTENVTRGRTVKYRLDAETEYDIPDAVAAALDKAKGRADSLETEIKALKERASPAALAAAVKARTSLITQATAAVGAEQARALRLDSLDSDHEIRLAALSALTPGKDYAARAPAYVEGVFEAAIERAVDARDSHAAAAAAAQGAGRQRADAEVDPIDSARAAYIERARAWTPGPVTQ